jgi:hypothetical protein
MGQDGNELRSRLAMTLRKICILLSEQLAMGSYHSLEEDERARLMDAALYMVQIATPPSPIDKAVAEYQQIKAALLKLKAETHATATQ